MNFPLHWITSLHLWLHEPNNFLQKLVVILSQSSFRNPHKSSIVWGFPFWAFSPMIFHTFSRGSLFGLCGGHFITAIPSSSRKLNPVLALWKGALSCVNRRISTDPLRKWGRACWWSRSLWTLVSILRWKRTMGPNPAEEIIPYTMTLPPPNLSFLKALKR